MTKSFNNINHSTTKNNSKKQKTRKTLHANNIHNGRYNLTALSTALPELKRYLITNPMGEATIDFSKTKAVKLLNKALLKHHYDIDFWDIPENYLCPAIPGRADYIHHIAELLSKYGIQNTSRNNKIHALDIGTGANCIYPILAVQCYDWQMTATDIDPISLANAQNIITKNTVLTNQITLRKQNNQQNIFEGIITDDDFFDITLCNPPFHASITDALSANITKQHKLAKHQRKRKEQQMQTSLDSKKPHDTAKSNLNFGGQGAELWCAGGERAFLLQMANESVKFKQQVGWFTSLVSKEQNILPLKKQLRSLAVSEIKQLPMRHGQKSTRIIAWTWF